MTRRSRTPLAEAMYEIGSGRQIADACGVSQSMVSRWKRGERKVPVRYRKTIAKVLKVSMKSLWPPEDKA
jgi:transcriptional regulator with XRE-family HTH domain